MLRLVASWNKSTQPDTIFISDDQFRARVFSDIDCEQRGALFLYNMRDLYRAIDRANEAVPEKYRLRLSIEKNVEESLLKRIDVMRNDSDIPFSHVGGFRIGAADKFMDLSWRFKMTGSFELRKQNAEDISAMISTDSFMQRRCDSFVQSVLTLTQARPLAVTIAQRNAKAESHPS